MHGDDVVIDVELQGIDEPAPEFAQSEPVAHRQRARADETFPTGTQQQPFHRTPRRIGTVEHPDRFAVARRFFEDITQGRDEGIDAATQVLQIDEQHIEAVHHRRRRAAYLAVEAEHGNAVHRVDLVRRFHHVVLFVATQTVLRAEGGGKSHLGQHRQRVECVDEFFRHRSGMRQQRDAAAPERADEFGVDEQAVESGQEWVRCFHGLTKRVSSRSVQPPA